MNKNNQYKSIFLSDIHLGFNGCQNEKLEHFLGSVSCENLYLVGDIIDFWSMEDKFYWPEGHQKVLNTFDQMFKNGTNIFYISGNHDDPLRDRDLKENLKFKNNNYAEIMNVLSNFKHEEKHEFLSIKHGKIIVLHGDQYDAVTSNAKWIFS